MFTLIPSSSPEQDATFLQSVLLPIIALDIISHDDNSIEPNTTIFMLKKNHSSSLHHDHGTTNNNNNSFDSTINHITILFVPSPPPSSLSSSKLIESNHQSVAPMIIIEKKDISFIRQKNVSSNDSSPPTNAIRFLNVGPFELIQMQLPSQTSIVYLIPHEIFTMPNVNNGHIILLTSLLYNGPNNNKTSNKKKIVSTINSQSSAFSTTMQPKPSVPASSSNSDKNSSIQSTTKNNTSLTIEETTADKTLSNENNNLHENTSTTYQLPKFPTLDVKLLGINNQYENFTLNSQIPVDIETNLFIGKMNMILRPMNDPATEDPYWYERIFSKKKRRIVIQIQGKFKYIPTNGNIIYAGAEISNQMKLGLITRGLCSILLKLVESFYNNIHYSFGDHNNIELPHIVAPANAFFDVMIQTPNNEIPPNINELFVETSESVSLRKKSSSSNSTNGYQWNTNDTYSFAFFSMYIDLPSWQLVGIPARGDLSLKTFWGNSFLSICMYENKSNNNSNNKHIHKDNIYAFSVQAKYLGKNYIQHQNSDQSSQDSDQLNNNKNETTTLDNVITTQQNDISNDNDDESNNIIKWSENYQSPNMIPKSTTITDENNQNIEICNASFSLLNVTPGVSNINDTSFSPTTPRKNDIDDDDDNDSNDGMFYFDAEQEEEVELEENQQQQEQSQDTNSVYYPCVEKVTTSKKVSKKIPFSIELLTRIDYYCPAWLDICSTRSGSYNKVYIINKDSITYIISEKNCDEMVRIISNTNNRLDYIIKSNFSPRMSSSENLRRLIGIILTKKYNHSSYNDSLALEKVNTMIDNTKHHMYNTLSKRNKPTYLDKTMMIPTYGSCYVTRAISDRHWIDEFMILAEYAILFYNPMKPKIQFRIIISNITKLEILDPDLCPHFIGYHFLVIQTLIRSHYIMFLTEDDLNITKTAIQKQLMKVQQQQYKQDDNCSIGSYDSNKSSNSVLDIIENPTDEFLLKSTMWHCKNRRLLNCSQFIFKQDIQQHQSISDPIDVIEDMLRKGIESLSNRDDNDNTTSNNNNNRLLLSDDYYEQRRIFLNNTSILKSINLHGASENVRLAFYLNLYHLMITHAYLVVGPPDSSLKWLNYYNNIAYEVGDDVFSITELEHCIIRSAMSKPSHFISRFVLPKSRYRITLTKPNYRINFALNCGSLSNPEKILIYRTEHIQQQLDVACQLYIQNSVSYSIIKKTINMNILLTKDVLEIRLPKMCQWFYDDFGSSNEQLLNTLVPYFSNDLRQILSSTYRLSFEKRYDMNYIQIRYHSFHFECRSLSL